MDEAERHLEAALHLHREVPLPLERVQTLLSFGTFLRRRGRTVAARSALREALEVAGQVGSRLLATISSEELSAAGGRRHRSPEDRDLLTAQEAKVAHRAVEGLTSRDIAAQLHVAPRTIETHLERIYAKLGVHSRRELRRRLESHPRDQP